MTPVAFLWIQLASEASEVAHIATKTAQFGTDEVMPGQPLTNAQRVAPEVVDFLATVKMLEDANLLRLPTGEELEAAIQRKRGKVNSYMAFACMGAKHPMTEPPVRCHSEPKG